MPEGGKSDIADEAKGVSERFIQSLGLVELILGGVGLYWLGIWYGAEAARLFPTTGLGFVDAGLLAFAAALLGKLLCLLVAFLMALTRLAFRKRRWRYYVQLERAVCAYLGAAGPADVGSSAFLQGLVGVEPRGLERGGKAKDEAGHKRYD
jgi:hypothetical protein